MEHSNSPLRSPLGIGPIFAKTCFAYYWPKTKSPNSLGPLGLSWHGEVDLSVRRRLFTPRPTRDRGGWLDGTMGRKSGTSFCLDDAKPNISVPLHPKTVKTPWGFTALLSRADDGYHPHTPTHTWRPEDGANSSTSPSRISLQSLAQVVCVAQVSDTSLCTVQRPMSLLRCLPLAAFSLSTQFGREIPDS